METAKKLTPMMRQYLEMKKGLPKDSLLLFRAGDFYEMFFDDARKGSKLMEITLTQRAGVPMAGVPYHALQTYLSKILNNKVKVAIAEQVGDPKTAKGIVKREIVRIITPGTLVDTDVLTAKQNNFLLSIWKEKFEIFGIASLDISTGELRLCELNSHGDLENEIHRLNPAECLIPESLYQQWKQNGFPDSNRAITWTASEDWNFDYSVTYETLLSHFKVASLDGFGCRDYHDAICAAGAVLHYIQHNLHQKAYHITRINPYDTNDYLMIDRISQQNLELMIPLFNASKDSTLLSVLDQTSTAMGARRLREFLQQPLLAIDRIQQRLDAVAVFVDDPLLLLEFRERLSTIKDLERIISRLNMDSANARDLLLLKQSLDTIPSLKFILSKHQSSSLLRELGKQLHEHPKLAQLIQNAILNEAPLTIKNGGLIQEGYNAQLDELRQAARDGKRFFAEWQHKEQERLKIKSLKVHFNKIFGYYIEVSKANLNRIPSYYIRKQTMVHAERFITPELKRIEDIVLGAEDKSKALEYELFQDIRSQIIAKTQAIQHLAWVIATVDVIATFAEIARKHNYIKPQINASSRIDIQDGRHPVVDYCLNDNSFIPNDIHLDTDSNQMIILTGPNMAGKSTYIRQVALLVLMAQMGSYIPARSAKIGIVDRIFTRIGASDDLSRGQSTFMTEMLETANILNNVSPKSLVILDEIGRGTSTFDGVSIAWAVAEYLLNTPGRCARTFFATHYHELTEIVQYYPKAKNYNVVVKEIKGTISFLHKIRPGPSNKSYGIHVARLAGLPNTVIKRSLDILKKLEGNPDTLRIGYPLQSQVHKKDHQRSDISDLQPQLFE